MKIKMYLSVLFLATSISIVSAQQVDNVFLTVALAKNLDNTIGLSDSNGNLYFSNINGSPYEQDTFAQGKAVSKKLNNSMVCFLRYNIYNDIIEIKDDNSAVGLIKSLHIYAIISGTEYHYEDFIDVNKKSSEGYFILLSKGSIITLYLRKTKTFKEAVKAESSYYKDEKATFIDSQSYYFKKHSVLIPLSHKKKELLQLFPKNEKDLNHYFKKHKVDAKSEEDMVKLFSYLDSILK
jgi:hypothetical protein